MTNEKEVLKKIFWPEDKYNLFGNMIFSSVSEDFLQATEVAISRNKDSLEIFYSTSELADIENKNYLVKLYYVTNDSKIELDAERSSPEIKTKEDIEMVLNAVQHTILLLNTRPMFFPTGVDENYVNESKVKAVIK